MNKNTLYRFFMGRTSPEEEKQIKEWMQASNENTEKFFKERKLMDAMLILGNSNKNSVNAGKERKASRLALVYRQIARVAAIVILTLSCNYVIQRIMATSEPVSMQTVFVPAGQRISLTLPDGTNVWLNSHTTFQYPVNFNQERRLVKLNGEAYFEVNKDPKKPFVVETSKYNIKVLGTKFNLNAYNDQPKFETILREGKVQISSAKSPSEIITLSPGEKADLVNGKIWVNRVEDYDNLLWTEGVIVFKEESFQSIISELERYFNVTMKIENPDKYKKFYTGKFRQVDGVEYALKTLQRGMYFTFERSQEGNVIYIK